jgi:2-succinyl-6-hydroxy-2,4-cyclohexadiene-1-carboxylate synthase
VPGRQRRDDRQLLATEHFGSGGRVALVHGFSQTGRSWRPVTEALQSRFEIVTVDLPGHGRSATVDAADLDQAGRLLVDSVEEANFVGYSMGGRVVLHAAFKAPASVRSMVLVGVSPGIEDERERADRRRADDALADRLEGRQGGPLPLGDFLDEWLSQPLFADLSDDAQGRAAREENAPSGLARTLRRLGTGTQIYDAQRLRALSMPVLLVAGERDTKFRELSAEVARVIGKNATTAVVDSAGHAVPFENPGEFVSLLESWIDEHGGA